MPLFLFNESWWAGINAVWGLMGLLILVALGIFYLLSSKRRETDTINEKRAIASDALVKVRDQQIKDLQEEITKLKEALAHETEELEQVSAEYRALAGIVVSDLLRFAELRRDKQAHWDNIEEQNSVLKKRLALKEGDENVK